MKLLLASCFHRYAEVNGKLRNHFRNVIVEPHPIGTPSFSNSISYFTFAHARCETGRGGLATTLFLLFTESFNSCNSLLHKFDPLFSRVFFSKTLEF